MNHEHKSVPNIFAFPRGRLVDHDRSSWREWSNDMTDWKGSSYTTYWVRTFGPHLLDFPFIDYES